MSGSVRLRSNWVSLAFGAAIVLAVALALIASLNGTTTGLGGSGVATTSLPAAGVGTPGSAVDGLHGIQQGQNGQLYPGGAPDEVSGAHDVTCPSGDECP